MKKIKIILVSMILVLSLGSITACGKKEESSNIIEQEVDIGTQLEDKANDQVQKQSEQSSEADQMLDNIPTD